LENKSKKNKNIFVFEIKVKDEKSCNSILEILSEYDLFEEKHDIKLYKNKELFSLENKRIKENELNLDIKEDIKVDIKDEEDQDPVDLLLAENITLTKEKLYQIFFIFGDIIDILHLKDQV